MRIRQLIIAALASASCAGISHAALYVTPNGLGVYDSTQNITWLRDANLAATDTFGVSGIDSTGNMGASTTAWNTAQAWINAMNAAGYLGVTTWRLPNTVQPDPTCSNQTIAAGYPPQGFGGGCTASEMGHLAEVDGITSPTPGPFSNIKNDVLYWSVTAYAPDTTGTAHWHYVYEANCLHGQGQGSPLVNTSAWPVAPGNPLGADLGHPFVPTIVVAQIGVGWYPVPPMVYDVVQGDLGVLRGTSGDFLSATDTCVASQFAPSACVGGTGCTNGNCVQFTTSPAPGGAYWFLMRPVGGSYNLWDSTTAAPRDAGINAAPAACP